MERTIYCKYNYNGEDQPKEVFAKFLGLNYEHGVGADIVLLEDIPDGEGKGTREYVHLPYITAFYYPESIPAELVYDDKCKIIGSKTIDPDTDSVIFTPLQPMCKDDQSIKADAGKPKLTLVPQQIIFDIAKVREYGLQKYGEKESWREVDIHRYRDAAFRHFLAYLRDPEGVDKESGLPHLAHLACNVAFLSEMENNN